MKISLHNKQHHSSYRLILGCNEVRDAGFLTEDGESKELVKIVDPKRHRIIIQLADIQEKKE